MSSRNIREDSIIDIFFNTTDSIGAPIAPSSAFTTADFAVHKDGSAVQKTSIDGLTVASPFDGKTGLHLISIDTSNDTNDPGFWTVEGRYEVRLETAKTVDSISVDGRLVPRGQFYIADPWATTVPGIYGAGTAGYILGTYLDQSVSECCAGGQAGPGSIPAPFTIQKDGLPVAGVKCWVTTDSAGLNTIAGTLITDDFGNVIFWLDVGTYYLRRDGDSVGYCFTNPYEFTVIPIPAPMAATLDPISFDIPPQMAPLKLNNPVATENVDEILDEETTFEHTPIKTGGRLIPTPFTIQKKGLPVAGVKCRVTTDSAGLNTVTGTFITDALGKVMFWLDVGTYYLWRDGDSVGSRFTNPYPFTVS